MGKEVWTAVKARRGWTGLLFCVSPVGTVALTNIFSAVAKDYGVTNQVVELVNGYGGGFVTAAGALATGFVLDRFKDRRKLYLIAGVATAACCLAMAMAPLKPSTFIVGCLVYLLIAGLAYASFSAVVYEIVGTAGGSASTLYSVFPAAGNQAIAYTLFLDGKAQHLWGTRGLLYADAALNISGVIALLLLLRFVFPDKSSTKDKAERAQLTIEASDSEEKKFASAAGAR
jgi:MFS family permease